MLGVAQQRFNNSGVQARARLGLHFNQGKGRLARGRHCKGSGSAATALPQHWRRQLLNAPLFGAQLCMCRTCSTRLRARRATHTNVLPAASTPAQRRHGNGEAFRRGEWHGRWAGGHSCEPELVPPAGVHTRCYWAAARHALLPLHEACALVPPSSTTAPDTVASSSGLWPVQWIGRPRNLASCLRGVR